MLTEFFLIEIPMEKMRDYLLNPEHSDGKSKEKYFRLHGISEVHVLEQTLLAFLRNNRVTKTVQIEYGTKYIVDGPLSATIPSVVRTVWIVLHQENVCKFVTAYPL